MKFENTVKDFGDEWEKFDNQDLDTIELKKFLNHTFIFFQRKDLIKKIGIDLGSGSGRWAKLVAPKVKKLYLLEPSGKAIEVSKKLKFNKNVTYINKEIKDIDKIKKTFDFAYSLGVIHHLSYPEKAFKLIRSKLKKILHFWFTCIIILKTIIFFTK